MKVTLRLSDGRKMAFSKEELAVIVEKHFKTQEEDPKKQAIEAWSKSKQVKVFEVNPLTIDQTLFMHPRRNLDQEKTRQLILDAFEEIRNCPERAKAFKTYMPPKTWEYKKVSEIKKIASQIGDHNADWVEQALEWAQRISNGEPWENICNKYDTAHWYRLVVWKNKYSRLVGGSRAGYNNFTPSTVSVLDSLDDYTYDCVVPLVVFYD